LWAQRQEEPLRPFCDSSDIIWFSAYLFVPLPYKYGESTHARQKKESKLFVLSSLNRTFAAKFRNTALK